MKRAISLFLLISLLTVLPACSQTASIKADIAAIGDSEIFTDEELAAAAYAAVEKFKDFDGCTLLEIRYDEEYYIAFMESYDLAEYNYGIENSNDNVIIMLSDFDVDASGGDGSFNPNSTYSDWNWIIVRNDKSSPWRVVDWGY